MSRKSYESVHLILKQDVNSKKGQKLFERLHYIN